jgi:hypothetical protein
MIQVNGFDNELAQFLKTCKVAVDGTYRFNIQHSQFNTIISELTTFKMTFRDRNSQPRKLISRTSASNLCLTYIGCSLNVSSKLTLKSRL